MKKGIFLLALIVCLSLAMSASAALPFLRNNEEDTVTISREEYERFQQYSKLDLLMQIVDMYYYEDVDVDAMLDGAASGLMAGIGDVYSCYYTKEQMDQINEETEGVYCGIGCQLLADSDTYLITVTRVFKDSPADKAGILPGDKIVYVNDVYYNAYAMDEAVSVMRGAPDESVKVTVLRDFSTIDFDIIRKEVTINYVEYEILPENIGYIILYDFYGNAVEGFAEALETFKAAGVKGVVIDLRNNGGGVVDIAVNIADLILPEGVVVSTRDKQGNEEFMEIDDQYYEVPLAVLVNEYTASASEILSGAIRDYNAGFLVGTKTFGKGVIQAELQFTDGTGMKVTMARYYTPSGVCIHDIGLEPDIDIELNKEVVTKYGYNNLPHDQDNQLQAAVRILSGESTLEDEQKIAEEIKAQKAEAEAASATAELDAAMAKKPTADGEEVAAEDETAAEETTVEGENGEEESADAASGEETSTEESSNQEEPAEK